MPARKAAPGGKAAAPRTAKAGARKATAAPRPVADPAAEAFVDDEPLVDEPFADEPGPPPGYEDDADGPVGESTAAGIAHLQAAAKEMIAAGRAMLDAAEGLVQDPDAVATVVAGFGALAKAASEAVTGRPPAPRSGPRPDDDEPRVERIRVR